MRQGLRNVSPPQRVLHGRPLGFEESVEDGAIEYLDDGGNGRPLPLGVRHGHKRKVKSGLGVREHLSLQALARVVNTAIAVEIGLDGGGRRDAQAQKQGHGPGQGPGP